MFGTIIFSLTPRYEYFLVRFDLYYIGLTKLVNYNTNHIIIFLFALILLELKNIKLSLDKILSFCARYHWQFENISYYGI